MPRQAPHQPEVQPAREPEPPAVAITMGDPLGIGPEVLVKALASAARRGVARWRIYGLSAPLEQAARQAGIEPFWTREGTREPAPAGAERTAPADEAVSLVEPPGAEAGAMLDGPPRATGWGGGASMLFLEAAIADCRRAEGDPRRVLGLVTGPISKHAWALAGLARYPGHTELLAERLGGARVRMMFEAPGLRTILVTTHIPLSAVPGALKRERVLETIVAGHEACVRLGVAMPRIAVCGLNPHAGEAGLFGDDESRSIAPAIEEARRAGIDAQGPFPGDTVFGAARAGRFDMVVAMYHDQGLIPVKLLAFDRAVNVTLGLPCVRTSPDHGTAYDIAGRNVADPGSMGAAMDLAVRLCA